MSVTDEDRDHLFRLVGERLDERAANVMRAMLPPQGHSALARQDDMIVRFDLVERRFEQVDRRFEEVDRRFDAVDRRLDRIDDRMDRLESALREQTRFYVACVFAAVASVSAIVGVLTNIA